MGSVSSRVARCCLIAALVPWPSFSHHGFAAQYDIGRSVTVQGRVAAFDFISPHSFLYIESNDEAGNVTWKCELPGRNFFARRGLPQDFVTGEIIRVEGIAARRSATECNIFVIHRADGSIVHVRGPGANSLATVHGIRSTSAGIEGTWVVTNATDFLTRDHRYGQWLTPTARLAQERYDPNIHDPARRCSPASPHRAWGADPNEIRREGDRIVIRHEFMDTQRVVRLDLQEHPDDTPRTEMGLSIGRFDNSSLVIETAAFSEGILIPHLQEGGVSTGIPHSEELRFTERLTVDAETDQMEIDWIAEDPAYYTRPLTGTWTLARTDLTVAPFDCVPDE